MKNNKGEVKQAIKSIEGYKSSLNLKQAFKILSENVDEKNSLLLFALGAAYDFGYGVKKNQKLALVWYLKSAELGHRVAQYNLYLIYRDGVGTKASITKALFWLKKSARNSFNESVSDLGYSYFKGKGVKKNEKLAVKYYKRAAERNFPRALFNLGLCYLDGSGVKQSDEIAIKLLKKALRLKHYSAADILADIYSGDYEPEIKKDIKLQKKYLEIWKKNK